ncbi:MAG TPA: hypothetical protein VGS27_03550 [Candidatus Sulfotelmatobacter sp.]|nr:hypothetical protein [Candidatus Sulfotelmatobacter sp.]
MLKTKRDRGFSSNDFSRVLAALRASIDPAKVTREFAAQHSCDAGFARRLVDTASARLWLDDQAPAADVLTMLEVRYRFELSPGRARAYAVEILWTVQHSIDGCIPHAIPTTKEARYAAA